MFADQRNRVDRDALAADVVSVRFGDRAERHLADLRAAAHDDDALAVDPLERFHHLHAAHNREPAQVLHQLLRRDARVAHLLVQMEDRRVLAVVLRADALCTERDRLHDRLELQRPCQL